MKKIGNTILIVCLSYAVFLGCDNVNNPVASNQQDIVRSSADNETSGPIFEATINNYNITTQPGTYDDVNDVTTFTYAVSYSGKGPSSNNFYLEIPECAVDKLIPESLVNPSGNPFIYPYEDNLSGTTGVLYKSSLSRKTSNFSISFNGNVPNGKISATVESGNKAGTGGIAGPCKGYEEEVEIFEVSGFVFVDVDANLNKNSYETGIFNVILRLQGPGGYDEVDTSDVRGKFSFLVPASSSDYTLTIPRTINGDEFNKQFFKSYDYAAANVNEDDEPETTLTVTDSDQSFDFAFLANTDELISQLNNKEILNNVKDFAFWRKMVRHAANETEGNVEIPQEDIYEYLYLIEQDNFFTRIPAGILPDNPFIFVGETDAERAEYALQNFLFNPSDENKTPLELFLRELLLAELNIVSGHGVQGFKLNTGETCSGGDTFVFDNATYCTANVEEFHLALLGYGEGLAAEILNNGTSDSQKLSTSSVTNTSLESGTQVFSTFNRTGTGGLD
jgi:hypothetical protein